jgi:hypothetical protein
MKKLIALAAVATMAWSSFGQGTVDFNNRESILGTANDYMVRFASDNSPVVNVGTSTYVAQLWYGAVGSDVNSFDPISPTANFRAETTSLPGTWSGGARTVPSPYGIGGATSVDLQVRVWDTSMAADWAAANDAAYLGQLGSSAVFTFNFFASAPPAVTDDDMVNFRGFTIAAVPEPSTFALLGLGALGMLIFRRK